MNTAQTIIDASYLDEGYNRPSDTFLLDSGGIKTNSSNWDEEGCIITSGYSFSPTDVWEFPDGSKLIVDYSGVAEC
jgi:hypothetical protein